MALLSNKEYFVSIHDGFIIQYGELFSHFLVFSLVCVVETLVALGKRSRAEDSLDLDLIISASCQVVDLTSMATCCRFKEAHEIGLEVQIQIILHPFRGSFGRL